MFHFFQNTVLLFFCVISFFCIDVFGSHTASAHPFQGPPDLINTSEKKIGGLRALDFNSIVFQQLGLMKYFSTIAHDEITKKVHDIQIIDLYNDVHSLTNDFIDKFVLKISDNNQFEKWKDDPFYHQMALDWLAVQKKLDQFITTYWQKINKDSSDPKIKILEQETKTFITSGDEALKDIMVFTLNTISGYITEHKTPVNQQSVIDFLSDQKWQILSKTLKEDSHVEVYSFEKHMHQHKK